MPYSGKDAFAQRDGQERWSMPGSPLPRLQGTRPGSLDGGSLNNEAVLGGSKPPRP
jgi:hypothetical protein